MFAEDARLVALVKPMFELEAAEPPTADEMLHVALARAVHAIDARWCVTGAIQSPVTGHRGARELLVAARRT